MAYLRASHLGNISEGQLKSHTVSLSPRALLLWGLGLQCVWIACQALLELTTPLTVNPCTQDIPEIPAMECSLTRRPLAFLLT